MSVVDPQANRRRLRRLGFGRLDHPVAAVDDGDWRPADDVLARALVLTAVLAVTAGLDATGGRRLLVGWDVEGALTDEEDEYLRDVEDGIRLADAYRATEAEALAALVWVLGLGDLPDDEPRPGAALPEPVPTTVARRPASELVAALDLYGGMVAALALDESVAVGTAPGPYDPYVARQRHRALAWVAGATW